MTQVTLQWLLDKSQIPAQHLRKTNIKYSYNDQVSYGNIMNTERWSKYHWLGFYCTCWWLRYITTEIFVHIFENDQADLFCKGKGHKSPTKMLTDHGSQSAIVSF